MVLVPLLVYVANRRGFGTATWVAALLLWATVLPLAVFIVKRRPQDLGLLPDGSPQGEAAPPAGNAGAPSAFVIFPARAALTNPARGTSLLLIVKVSMEGGHFYRALAFPPPPLDTASSPLYKP